MDENNTASLQASLDYEESALRSLLEPPAQGRTPSDSEFAPSQPTATTESTSPKSRCERAFRAISSMQRAADGICRLTSENDSQCKHAKERVARAIEATIRSGCPG